MPDEPESNRSRKPDTDRGLGILTKGQREYLLGNKEFEKAQSERDIRYKIRERVRNALLDFEILAEYLEPRDRKQIFKDVRTASERGDRQVGEKEIPRVDEVTGLVHAISFLYKASKDLDMSFERAIEYGVRESKEEGEFIPNIVEVKIEDKVDYEQIFGKIENDVRLTEFESMSIAGLVAEDFDRYVSLCKDVDVDVEEKLEAGEPLSVGESYVLFGLLSDDGRYREYDVEELVHDEVRSRLGPHSI